MAFIQSPIKCNISQRTFWVQPGCDNNFAVIPPKTVQRTSNLWLFPCCSVYFYIGQQHDTWYLTREWPVQIIMQCHIPTIITQSMVTRYCNYTRPYSFVSLYWYSTQLWAFNNPTGGRQRYLITLPHTSI